MKQLITLAMIAFLVPTAAALAENPCREDKVKFCKDEKASGGKVSDCLRRHKEELSEACKERLAQPRVPDPAKAARKAEKEKAKAEKPAEEKPAEAMKPAEPAPSDAGAAPSEPETPGATEPN